MHPQRISSYSDSESNLSQVCTLFSKLLSFQQKLHKNSAIEDVTFSLLVKGDNTLSGKLALFLSVGRSLLMTASLCFLLLSMMKVVWD